MMDRVNVQLGGAFIEMWGFVRDRLRREGGQAFVEYTLVILLIAIAVATGALVDPFRNALKDALTSIANAIQTVITDNT